VTILVVIELYFENVHFNQACAWASRFAPRL